MFNLNKAIQSWKIQLRKNQALEDGYIRELESHLQDEYDEAVGRGLSQEEAFKEAVTKIGSVENVGEEYFKSDSKSLSKRPPWKTNPFVPALLNNYLKTAARNIRRSRTYSIINILGLSISLVTFAIFALGMGVHLNADKFHDKADRIFGVVAEVEAVNKEINHTTYLPAPLLNAMISEFPEIETGVRVSSAGRLKLQYDEKIFYENFALFADKNVFDMFTFNLVKGDEKRSLENPRSILITEDIAAKYFGDEEAVGKSIIVNDNVTLVVTGVIENVSRLSSLRFDFLIPMESAPLFTKDISSWGVNNYTSFLLLNNSADAKSLEQKLPGFVSKYWNMDTDQTKSLYLMALTDFRLKSENISSPMRSTKLAMIVLLGAFGGLLLIIASFNFINLSIARFMTRVKEIGMRKVIGAGRFQIIKQFMTESILIAMISFVLSIIIYELCQGILTGYLSNLMHFDTVTKVSNSIFNYPYLLQYMFAAALFSGILSGLFPALHVSSVKPVDSLKGSSVVGKSKRRGTKILLVSQFALSIMIIVFAQLFNKQIDHWVNNANFGYSRTNVAVIQLPTDAADKRELLMNEFSNHPAVETISASQNIPGLWSDIKMAKLPSLADEEAFNLQTYRVDYNFMEVFRMPVISGRTFAREFQDESSIILNEAAAKRLGLDDPIGEIVRIEDRDFTVVGLTKDFVFYDIGFDIDPSIIYLGQSNFNYIVVKLSKHYSADIQQSFSQTWNSILPNIPFKTYDMDTFFNDIWSMGFAFIGLFQLIGYFAVAFSFIGLIGLVSFMINRRTKEIGIRKVLGASIPSIMNRILTEFAKLVLIANLIAAPVTYYLWNKIIQTGLLHMQPFSMKILAITIVVTIVSAVVFIAMRIYKTASVNPSESLRYE